MRGHRPVWLGSALGLVVCLSCGESSPPDAVVNGASSYANSTGSPPTKIVEASVEGAVLTVAGRPILASELEALADAAELAAPEYTRAHDRRLALELVLIPCAALAAAHPKAWDEAKTKALAAVEQLRANPRSASDLGTRLEQVDVRQLGLPLWNALQHSPRGAWVGPLEAPGRWRMARWIAMTEAPSAGKRALDCELLDVWYLAEENTKPFLNAALAQAELLIHDKATGELITERTRWRMKRL